jgi:outer membrane protein assembly factor BamB
MVVAAFDLEGNKQWIVHPGEFVSAHGFSSCPVLYDDLVIINGDHDGDSYIIALDKATGDERWRRKRKHGIRSYVTPIIRQVAGRTQMVFSGSHRIVSLDPKDGAMHWSIEGPTDQFVASMVFDGSQFYMNCGFPDYFVVAVRPDGSGDVTDSGTVWESTQARSYVPSPVVLNGYLLVADDRGTANCFDTKTGNRLWQARVGKGFSSSLVHANGLVYFSAQDGEITTIRPGAQPDIVAKNHIGENMSSSPAISDGCIYLRGEHTLFCIGKPE